MGEWTNSRNSREVLYFKITISKKLSAMFYLKKYYKMMTDFLAIELTDNSYSLLENVLFRIHPVKFEN